MADYFYDKIMNSLYSDDINYTHICKEQNIKILNYRNYNPNIFNIYIVTLHLSDLIFS